MKNKTSFGKTTFSTLEQTYSSLDDLLKNAPVSEYDNSSVEVLVDTCSFYAMNSENLYSILSRENNPSTKYSLKITSKVAGELLNGMSSRKIDRILSEYMTKQEKKKYRLALMISELNFTVHNFVPSKEIEKEIIQACQASCEKHISGKDPIEDTDIGVIAYGLSLQHSNPVLIISQDYHILNTVNELRKPKYNQGRGYTNICVAKYKV